MFLTLPKDASEERVKRRETPPRCEQYSLSHNHFVIEVHAYLYRYVSGSGWLIRSRLWDAGVYPVDDGAD